jgi:nucleotide-binding universal stress UspA family protein
MSVRRILVPVRLDGKGENVLDHAMALAGKNSHIEVVHCRPGPKDLIPFGVSVPSILREQITASGDELADQEEKRVVELFEAYAKSRKLKVVDVGAAHPKSAMSATFRVERGKQANIVSMRGRLADVVAVAKPDRDRAIGRNTLEAALVNTGSLVMMCPENAPPKRIGERIAIAWNGSRESARAMTLALPMMASAKKISVMTIAGEKLELTGAHVLSYLGDHDIDAEHLEIKEGHNIGESLVAGAGTCGADCLLMGAYGSSRGRELVLGGATQYVVDHASIPVLMAH